MVDRFDERFFFYRGGDSERKGSGAREAPEGVPQEEEEVFPVIEYVEQPINYRPTTVFPIEFMLTMSVMTQIRARSRKHVIQSSSDPLPVILYEWMMSDSRWSKLFSKD